MGWLLAILAGGFLTFNAIVTPDKAADEATKALQKQFPGAEVKVVIEGKRGKDVLNGRFRTINIELANLTLDELPIAAGTASNGNASSNKSTSSTASKATSGTATSKANGVQSNAAPAKEPQREAVKVAKPKLGRAGDLDIVVRNFKWQSLPVERADFHFSDVEYDFGALKNQSQFKLVRVGKSSMHLELAPGALTPFIAKRVENVSNASVKLGNGELAVNGTRTFYGVAAPFEVRGQPAFSGSQVILKSPKLLFSGVAVPALISAPILKSVNPLYSFDDLQGLPFAVTLTKVESRDGKLQIDGDLTLKQ